MLQVRYKYEPETGKSILDLHRRGESVEELTIAEAQRLMESLLLHMSMAYYDQGGK